VNIHQATASYESLAIYTSGASERGATAKGGSAGASAKLAIEDLNSRQGSWLRMAAKEMATAVKSDWRDYRAS
jgi:hypothetical protein